MADCGIYCIKNLSTNKVYIGQALDINKRWKEHKRGLANNRHFNSHLQRAWNKYGENNFEFSILEECDKRLLEVREVYWINHYNSCDRHCGYNVKLGGLHGGHHKETKIKLSEFQKTRKIHGFSSNPFGLGSKHSEETKRKMSEQRKGQKNSSYGRKKTSEELKKISDKLRILSDEQIIQIYKRAWQGEK